MNRDNKKIALIIGINYFGQKGELGGCLNDVDNLSRILIEKFNFKKDNIVIMRDDEGTPKGLIPTRDNIIKQINNFINKKKYGFRDFWFSYSGHGYYVKDKNGDEKDGRDEAICPVDYAKYNGVNGLITDDLLYNLLVPKLGKGDNLHILMDCCHSGSIIDLPYYYDKGKISTYSHRKQNPKANIVKLSGSKDEQTSADIYVSNWEKRAGALTMAFEKIIDNHNYNITYRGLIESIRSYLKVNKFSQIPILSFSKNNILNTYFIGEKSNKNILELSIEGDEYASNETSYNIIKLADNSSVFGEDRIFHLNNEKSTINIELSPGKYKIFFKDTYGDGGCTSTLKLGDEIIEKIKFNDGKYIEKEFTIKDSNEKKEVVDIYLKGDYYCNYKRESTWNIIDREGIMHFQNDIHFTQPFEEQHHSIKLKKGEYQLVLRDKWGDGGISGNIKINNKKLLNVNFTKGKHAFLDFTV